jgi:glyoxylase-like metal-dependent hydrolase (beta-lactamase superfamily II)
VITHAHGDHVGGLDQLTVEHGGQLVEVVAGQREASLLVGDFGLHDGEPAPRPKPRNYAQPQTRPTRGVQDGEHVGSLKVIPTPGHTPGHIALLDTRDGTPASPEPWRRSSLRSSSSAQPSRSSCSDWWSSLPARPSCVAAFDSS